jgi:hypothetical protein
MPFKSHAQESFLKHRHPAIYKRWLGEHGHYKGKKLHVKEGADMNKESGIPLLQGAIDTGKVLKRGVGNLGRGIIGAKARPMDPAMDDAYDAQEKAKAAMPKEASFPERVVETLQISALALQKAEQEAHEKTAAERRYATKIASAVEKCVKCGRIDDTPDEREKLAAWLVTPEGALEVIEKLAEHEVAPQTTAALGQQVDANGRPAGGSTKKASYDSVNDNYVGRRSGQEPESWRRLTAGLGVA